MILVTRETDASIEIYSVSYCFTLIRLERSLLDVDIPWYYQILIHLKIRVPWEKRHVSDQQTQHQDIVYHFWLGNLAWLSLEGTSLFQSRNSCAGPGNHGSPHLERGVGRKLKGERLLKRRKGKWSFLDGGSSSLWTDSQSDVWFSNDRDRKRVTGGSAKILTTREHRGKMLTIPGYSRYISNWIPLII